MLTSAIVGVGEPETAPAVQRSPASRRAKGEATRQRLLEIAQASVLAKGFAATSIDEVIAEAGITKSGFFYHFRDKNELARAMLQRYVEENDEYSTRSSAARRNSRTIPCSHTCLA